jgi:hypothetical protein
MMTQLKKAGRLILLCCIPVLLQSCFLTKVVTAPMRLGGAALSFFPVVGNTAHDAIDEVADKVDDIPI